MEDKQTFELRAHRQITLISNRQPGFGACYRRFSKKVAQNSVRNFFSGISVKRCGTIRSPKGKSTDSRNKAPAGNAGSNPAVFQRRLHLTVRIPALKNCALFMIRPFSC